MVLSDPDSRVRAATLAAFDDPFEGTPPHLRLTSGEMSTLLTEDLGAFYQLVAHLVGEGRLQISGIGRDTYEAACEPLFQNLLHPDAGTRLVSFRALQRLLPVVEPARATIRTATPGVVLFESAVFRFWINASEETRAQAVDDLRLSAAAIDWSTRLTFTTDR